jgi:hypothetical protein
MSEAGASYVGRRSADGRWRWDGKAWQPVTSEAQPGPAWLDVGLTRVASWRALAGALIVGLIADQALRSGAFGSAASLAVAAGAPILVFTGRLSTLQSRLAAAGAVLFAAWFSARASSWLLWPDLAMSFALLGLAASISVRGSLLDIGVAEAAARSIHALIHAIGGAAYVMRPLVRLRNRVTLLGPVARGLLIATPIAILLAAILASADPVFASFFYISLDFGRLARDAFFVIVGAWALAGLMRLAAATPVSRVNGPIWRLGSIEGLIVLAVLDAIFAAFAIAQALAATGAAGDTLRAAGLTYADYARSGFFQLLWVAGIAAGVLILFSRITGLTERRSKRAFLVLGQIGIVLTLLIVLVAFRRLSLYEEAYGFTMLRLYSQIFAVWIAVVFLLLAADMGGMFPKRRWFVGATFLSAMALLLSLNFLNPEAIVVNLNVDHARATHKLDVQYLAELSSDAIPALLASRSQVDLEIGRDIGKVACAGPRDYSVGPGAFNWSDAAAAGARRRSC